MLAGELDPDYPRFGWLKLVKGEDKCKPTEDCRLVVAEGLRYQCELMKDQGYLNCEFSRITVEKPHPRRLSLIEDEILKGFEEELKEESDFWERLPEMCGLLKEELDVVEGRKKAPRPERLKELSEVEKQDVYRMLKAWAEFCKTKSKESFLNAIRPELEKKMRTCDVSSRKYEHRFRRVLDDRKGITWVSDYPPAGSCEVLDLSRFERGEVTWNLVERQVVLNPQAQDSILRKPCKDVFDEFERLYTSTGRFPPRSVGCDYIDFRVIY